MCTLRNHSGWLAYKVKTKIERIHPELMDGKSARALKRIWNYVCHRDRYVLIPGGVYVKCY